MKALALLTAVAVTLFSVAASAQIHGAPSGKGKAPPRRRLLPKARRALGGRPSCRSPCFWEWNAEAIVEWKLIGRSWLLIPMAMIALTGLGLSVAGAQISSQSQNTRSATGGSC